MIKAVLFDLDGTLLPMDQDRFTARYFPLLTKKLEPYGIDPEDIIDALWKGTYLMVTNDGSRTNEAVIWDYFAQRYGEDFRRMKPVFEEFYGNEFAQAKDITTFQPKAQETVRRLKDAGVRLILATNPIFPVVATNLRIEWAGLSPSDFELITTYENFNYCKPNPEYYSEILRRCGLKAEDCLMVGNDVSEDMVATKLGMRTFLVKDCLINKKDIDTSGMPQGDFDDLSTYLDINL